MSINIGFQVYPDTNRVPGVFAEINNSRANSGQVNLRSLIIAQKLTAGTYPANIPVISTGVGDALVGCGQGSVAALMLEQYRSSDNFGETWLLPLVDDAAAVAATQTITPTGPATGPGTIVLYIAASPTIPETRVAVGVSTGDAATLMATNLAAAINAVPTLPVTAAAVAAVVTVTARNKGECGNDIDIRANFQGAAGGESLPPGVGLTFSNPVANGSLLTGGVTNPSLATALANIAGDQTFDFIVLPFKDITSLNAMQVFLNDQTGRWSWTQELFGGFFFAYRGTLSALSTFGVTRNDQHASAMGMYDSPTPSWLWAADYAANCAVSVRADPAQPVQTLQMNVFAPPLQSRFDIGERNTLLYDGISTFVVDDSGAVRIDRGVTTYQKNGSGAPDDSYLDIETMYTLQYLVRDMRIYLQSQFPRMKLVSDGTKIPFGSNMVTSKTVLASAVARYRQQCALGYAQNPDQFAQQAQSQNAGNGLVKLLLPFQLANQLRQIALLAQFTKP